MRGRSGLLGLALLAGAAAPQSGFSTAPTIPPIVSVHPHASNTPPGFAPAPLPNREASAPQARASHDATVSPSLITRRNQYRGEGIDSASSAQAEQDHRAKPGGGFNLSVPLQ